MDSYIYMLKVLISAILAMFVVRWIYFKELRLAKEKLLVDNPNARKLQKLPVPVRGGLTVFVGVVAGIVLFAALDWDGYTNVYKPMLGVICSMMLMTYIGSLDDIIGLKPKTRFVVEIVAILALILAGQGCINDLHGTWGIYEFSWWIGVPLTVFACVGIINAVNMIDGVNGLSSGLCIVYNIAFGVMFLDSHDYLNAALAFCLMAALIPFWMHNVFGKHSKMFIGDSGTMMMGMAMGWFVISLIRDGSPTEFITYPNHINPVAMALAILSVPVADTLRVMGMRMLKGKSPFKPDKTHLHHMFIKVGVSHSVTSISEILIDIVIILLSWLMARLGASATIQLYVVIAAMLILVWGTYAFLDYHASRHTKILHRITRFSLSTHLGHKEWWLKLQAKLDAKELEMGSMEGWENENPVEPGIPRIEKDRQTILDFIRGRAEVYVQEIKEKSGAREQWVDSILDEEEQKGTVKIIESGRFRIVTLIKDPTENE